MPDETPPAALPNPTGPSDPAPLAASADASPAGGVGPSDTIASAASTRSGGDAADAFPPTLVLGTSIVMASAAMEAYLEPTAGQRFRNRGANGTEMQYLDCEFAQAHLGAMLHVTVKSATGFSDVDRWSKPDLFVEVSAGASSARTTDKETQENPVFNEKLLLWPSAPVAGVSPSGPPTVSVRVRDVELRGSEEVGVGTLTLPADWETMSPLDTEVEIRADGGVRGSVTLTLDASKLSGDDDVGADAMECIAHPEVKVASGASDLLAQNVAVSAVLAPPVTAIDAVAANNDAAASAAVAAVSAGTAAAADPAPDAGGADAVPEDAVDVVPEDRKAAIGKAKEKMKEAWRKLPEVFPDAFLMDGTPVAFLESTNDTQVWVHQNKRLKQVVIAFRGTERSIRDWVTDLRFALNSITADEETGALRTVNDSGRRDSGWRSWLGPVAPLTRPALHKGFYLSYRSVQPQLRDVLAMITGGDPAWAVTTTGHSLGGALATICAYDLGTSRDTPYRVACHTFGCPRVGNDRFTAAYVRAVPQTFRFYNRNDLVAQVPWFAGYTHVPAELRIDAGDRLFMPDIATLSVFGDRFLPVAERKQILSEQGPVMGMSTWVRNRAGLMSSLWSREGIASHRSAEYVGTLSGVMLEASAGDRFEVIEAIKAVRAALSALRAVARARD
eukprot:jgi/Ulvmu1/11743/UM008_0156.1